MIEAWVETELGGVKLGDKRRTRRLMRTVQTFFKRPNASIPEASESAAEMQAIYGLLSAPTTCPEAIRAAHGAATVKRIEGCEEVLIVQDSSELSFNTLQATEGLGPLSGKYSRGLMMHSAMVTDLTGVPQGLLHQELWARNAEETGKSHNRRKRLIEEKESQKWLTTVRVCQERLPDSMKAWIVGDSEADIYELLAMPRRPGLELLIRATHNRRVQSSEGASYVWDTANAAPVAGTIEVELKRTPKREARMTQMEVRLCPELQILRPMHKQKNTPVEAIPASVVLGARTRGAAAGGRAGRVAAGVDEAAGGPRGRHVRRGRVRRALEGRAVPLYAQERLPGGEAAAGACRPDRTSSGDLLNRGVAATVHHLSGADEPGPAVHGGAGG
jgi:hypothetical protein